MNPVRSRKITDRFIECSKNGELSYSDELEILQYLFNRLNLSPLADAAKLKRISYNGMKKRIAAGKEMHIKSGNQIFVST